ncbi:unnamed protein product [Schistosoma mattheei]|uniref:Uncharacterized protein n=1 Tax=Schistosoma mattheei TaxID=31246 RepID=A0A3P8G2Q6_9TREM|nr:unnamed protein product [Schistosoma mattheei]
MLKFFQLMVLQYSSSRTKANLVTDIILFTQHQIFRILLHHLFNPHCLEV